MPASHTGRYFGWVAGGCLSVPCSSATLLKTCGPPMKASFGPTRPLLGSGITAAWGGSTSPGAIVKPVKDLLAFFVPRNGKFTVWQSREGS